MAYPLLIITFCAPLLITHNYEANMKISTMNHHEAIPLSSDMAIPCTVTTTQGPLVPPPSATAIHHPSPPQRPDEIDGRAQVSVLPQDLRNLLLRTGS